MSYNYQILLSGVSDQLYSQQGEVIISLQAKQLQVLSLNLFLVSKAIDLFLCFNKVQNCNGEQRTIFAGYTCVCVYTYITYTYKHIHMHMLCHVIYKSIKLMSVETSQDVQNMQAEKPYL